MSAKEPLTRENVERVAASVHADAVLATRLVSMNFGHGEGNSNDTRGDSVYKAPDFVYGAYGKWSGAAPATSSGAYSN
jgi:hypothetical protein